jgi:signal transduction histidine kinase
MPTVVDLSDAAERRITWWPLAVWTAAVLVYAIVLRVQIGLPFAAGLLSAAVYFYTLALLMMPVRRIAVRLQRDSAGFSRKPKFFIHAVTAIVVIAIWQAVQLLFLRVSIGPDYWSYVYAGTWLFQLFSAATVYSAALGLVLASLASDRERVRARRQHELEVAARDAELHAVKAQFQPHFVLNALNSLLALVDRDPALARTMIARLSDLMKSVFDGADAPQVPLERELDLVRAYLDVERIRLGSRLGVAFDVEDAARGVLVPTFLLQPIVENAVKHGVAPFAGSGRIVVSAAVTAGRLVVRVVDSGHTSLPEPTAVSSGRGLHITRRRLDGAYGDLYRLTMERVPDGTAVRIEVPAETEHVA